MKRLIKISKICMIAFIGMGLLYPNLGCQGETKGKKEPVVTKKVATRPAAKKSKAKSSSAPEVSKVDKATNAKPEASIRLPYDPVGKTDPFQPLYRDEPKEKSATIVKPKKKPERPRTPLERLDLAQLQLTAIVFSETRPRAMVEEDSGKGYVVQIGTHIGLERGQIVDIKRDRIVIQYSKTDDFGNTATKRRELKLQKPPGE